MSCVGSCIWKMISMVLMKDAYFLFLPKLVSSFHIVCNSDTFDIFHWHKKLWEPNSSVSQHLLNFGLHGNKNYALILFFILGCGSCKFANSNVLPFPSHGSHSSHVFDIVHSDIWSLAPIVSHACLLPLLMTIISTHQSSVFVQRVRFSLSLNLSLPSLTISFTPQ